MAQFYTTSLADQVFDKLENDIIHGIYKRGEVLTELKLVEQLGVSRTPIREALRKLEQERLIEERGKGSVVLGITDENMIDIMDIRVCLEPLASYYAALNITQEGIAQLSHIMDLQEFYRSKNDSEHLKREDEDFHDMICKLSGRSVIADTLIPLHRKTRRYRKISIDDPERQAKSLDEHREIFQAISQGDAVRASELTARHVENAKSSMIARLKNNG